MPNRNKDPFYIESFLIQPRQNRIGSDDDMVRVEPKVMDVLLCLAESPGQVVTRERLHETVWSGTFVSDDVLSRSISELRKVFEDDARNPRVIETIPKSGYRLLVPPVTDFHGDNLPISAPVLELSTRPTEAVKAGYNRPVLLAAASVLALLLVTVIVLVAKEKSTVVYHPRPLTTYPGIESSPRLSPDGQSVAFHWRGLTNDNLDIYIKKLGVETPLRVTTSPAFEHTPTWSPYGDRIAYIRRDDSGCHIWIAAALGGPGQELASCRQNIYGDLFWSPDGQEILYNDRGADETSYSIHAINVQSGLLRKLTNPPGDVWGDHDPAYSPDGSQLAFTRSVSEGMQDVFVKDLSNDVVRRITFDSRNIGGTSWTLDGSDIIVSSNRAGRFELWRVSSSGGQMEWAGIGDGQAFSPSISGRSFVYRRSTGRTNIWRFSVGSSEGRPIVESTQWDMHPAISPAGDRLAFTSNRSGSYEIWVSDLDGANARQLTYYGGSFTSSPRWHPDGKRLLFTARIEQQADIYAIDIAGGKSLPVTDLPESDELAGSWSNDGVYVYYSSNRTGEWQVWKRSLDGMSDIQITFGGGFGAHESTTGEHLYHAKHNEPGIWKTALDGSAAELVVPTLDPRDWGSWRIKGNSLYYVHRSTVPSVIKYDLESLTIDTLLVPLQQIPSMDPALDVSTDGLWLFIGQSVQQESDLMMVDNFQ